ncbi:mRNA-decapping enzyme 1-like [Tigriopus californicus]|uniref:mRNA-decapping enzyme 1-like n=1 Tax=Tigriopus californicus TaxID=6832 RepID=UPI0027DA675A|nr:mRNA-decapping enzyme 1-like [Tigriopus californicus]|eukprot:TCALIF_12563-PA protein Name:"Similar to Dcp1a mRNA-decapping enzyme 1A (Mus musculus)" AED:0.00 eAED:0.00 QI:152/1/1/1/1/1/7/317/514
MAHALTRSSASETRMNLATLTRVDPYVQSIVCQAKHVFLYYHKDGNWEKGDTEGPLFVYERVCEPKYGFIILNRLNQKSLIEPISKGLEFQSKPPFMLYKTKDEEIRGIWFYKEEECKMISAKVESLIKLTEEAALQNQRAEHPPKDLASLLSKASSQSGGVAVSANEAKASKAKVNLKTPKTADKVKPAIDNENGGNNLLRMLSNSANGGVMAPSGLVEEGNVAAFFAQANQSPLCGPPPQHQQPVAMMPDPRAPLGPHGPMMMRPPIMMPMMPPGMPLISEGNFQPSVLGAGSIPPETDGKQILQRLMSNAGVHSLEALEHDQRIQSQSPNLQRMPPLPVDAMKADDIESILGQKLSLNSASYAAAVSGTPQDPPISQVNAPMFGQGTPKIKQEPQELKLISPFDLVAPKASNESSTPLIAPHRSLIKDEPLDTYDNNGASPNLSGIGKLNGPPSTMSSTMPNGHTKQGRSDITPLTKEQLMQAFEHLLNSDPSFIGKLHQAYVESLNTKLH